MSKLAKIYYIDFDGTICEKDTPKFAYTNFEIQHEHNDFKYAISSFGGSMITQNTISDLKKLKQAEVTLVGVTARDFYTGTNINSEVLKCLDRVYVSSSLYCYNVKEGKMSEEYYNTYTKPLIEEIKERLVLLQSIFEAIGIPFDVFPKHHYEAYVYLNNTNNYSKDQYNKLVEYCHTHGFPTVEFTDLNILEICVCGVSKLHAVERDRGCYEESYAICTGDSVTDFTMLGACDLGIYPTSLLTKVQGTSAFTAMGTHVSKILSIRDDVFVGANLREALVVFNRVDERLNNRG